MLLLFLFSVRTVAEIVREVKLFSFKYFSESCILYLLAPLFLSVFVDKDEASILDVRSHNQSIHKSLFCRNIPSNMIRLALL